MDTSPDAFGIPSTQPFQGRPRMPTTPGVQEGADPNAPSRAPALGVLGRPADQAERPKQKTGTGLGPAAQRMVGGPTLVSAAEAAQNAKAEAEASLPLVLPEPPPPPREESVTFQLGDADIEDLAAAPPPLAQPPHAPGLRPLAQPMSFVEPETLEDSDLELPEIPEDEPTKVGAPSADELERARQEGLAMLLARQEEEEPTGVRAPAPPLPPPPLAVPAPPAFLHGAAEGLGFGTLKLGPPPAPPAAPPQAQAAAGYGAVTAPMAVAGTTQRLSSQPPPAVVPPPPVLVDVTPLTLAVETVEGFCDSIIGRNTTVPCSQTREFVTAADNQTSVRVRVSQGESKRFVENTLLGEIELTGLRPARRGDVRIAVSFALDPSGMLVVSAKDVGTGRETSTQVRLVGLPDAAEVMRMQARQVARGM
jgi:molecular chaperone DnaK